MLLFVSCQTDVCASSCFHLLNNVTKMSESSAITVACDASFTIFRVVLTISRHLQDKLSIDDHALGAQGSE